jgi:hypothetical protein
MVIVGCAFEKILWENILDLIIHQSIFLSIWCSFMKQNALVAVYKSTSNIFRRHEYFFDGLLDQGCFPIEFFQRHTQLLPCKCHVNILSNSMTKWNWFLNINCKLVHIAFFTLVPIDLLKMCLIFDITYIHFYFHHLLINCNINQKKKKILLGKEGML